LDLGSTGWQADSAGLAGLALSLSLTRHADRRFGHDRQGLQMGEQLAGFLLCAGSFRQASVIACTHRQVDMAGLAPTIIEQLEQIAFPVADRDQFGFGRPLRDFGQLIDGTQPPEGFLLYPLAPALPAAVRLHVPAAAVSIAPPWHCGSVLSGDASTPARPQHPQRFDRSGNTQFSSRM
jgi:hypothetical protein